MDYAEEILFTLKLTNNGVEDAPNVRASISSESPHITFIQTDTVYGDIAVGDTVSVMDGFEFQVSESVPDKLLVKFTVSVEDDYVRSVYQSDFVVASHAPILSFMDYEIDDNGDNGKLDPGETAQLIATIKNKGTSDAYNVLSQLTTMSPYMTILTDPQTIGDLAAGESRQITYQVQAAGDTPEGHIAGLALDLAADHNISVNAEFNTIIGQKPVLIIQFATASRSADSMVACLNTLSVGADVMSEFPENPDVYRSIFVLLGVFPDNYSLSAEEGQTLAAFLENGGSIYMEGGDAWFSDSKTAVHDLFFIEGIDDGADDLAVIFGEDEGILEGFTFEYLGPNNYIDHITPVEGAMLMMSNEEPEYGVAVSYENITYKTIGSSFNFEGLVNTPGSTKDGFMASMLSFFDIGFTWTSVEEHILLESSVSAYPNPFSGQVNIAFQIDQKSKVNLDIFDLTGRKIMAVVNDELNAGVHKYQWNADNQFGQHVTPGIYFYSLRVGDQVTTRKLILTR